MKNLTLIIAAAGCLAAFSASTASAEVVRERIVRHGHHDHYHHACRTVRVVKYSHGEKRVITRRSCR